MKKILISFVSTLAVFFLLLVILSNGSKKQESELRACLVTDFADVNDQSFNQAAYQAGKKWSKETGFPFNYYKPTENSDFERRKSIELAIDRGYNILILPGYTFAQNIRELAPAHPEVKFIGIDIAEGDFLQGNETNYQLPTNVNCIQFCEEISGYFAGYAAVKEGFKNFGFLGGIPAEAVIRFGNGFIQGMDSAASELAIQTNLTYGYGGQFYGDNDITASIDGWYQKGVECVFACGGSIFTSVALAAKNHNGYVIGVDSDQSFIINSQYGEGRCITSAMKKIEETVVYKLKRLSNKITFVAGYEKLGLVSGTDIDQNFVGLPVETWSMKNFTVEDYKKLVNEVFTKERIISNSVERIESTEHVKITYLGSIK
ncbi:MAG: BMP family ABC transporter substrate-binding protein [Bacilli bacterium]|nr:BMP family ABC transporter substrate-binding protein [Bacilli bacterium]